MRRISKGRCSICNGTFSKAAMTKHLEACKQKNASAKPSKKTKLLHLAVEGRHLPWYWMHLEAKADARLEDLDKFLREIWLECCGHLSAFTIGDKTYSSYPDEEFDDEDMSIALGKVLRPGVKFCHEYDFGTTTELVLKVVSEREGNIRGKIQLLARNDPPAIICACGKNATQVCCQCIYSGEGWLCDECAGRHECGEEMLQPVVNSPRVGMCGYTGVPY